MIARPIRIVPALLVALLAAPLAADAPVAAGEAPPASRAPESPVLDALRAELDRAMSGLRLEDLDGPYFASAAVYEREAVVAEGAGGALVPTRQWRQRWVRVAVRVGSHELDNSGFQGGGGFRVLPFPLDDEPVAMRRVVWLALDGAYKDAAATRSAKVAYLASRGEATKEESGDFTREDPVVGRFAKERAPLDRARVEGLASRLSRGFEPRSGPDGRVRVWQAEWRTTYADTAGSAFEDSRPLAGVEISTWDEADDGMPLRRVGYRYARSLEGLGKAEDLEREVARLRDDVRALALAKTLTEPYNGPVLLEGDAPATVFATIVSPRTTEPRIPIDTSGASGGGGHEWGKKLGSRVLSPLIDVVDDPFVEERAGVRLIGGYRVDEEGVLARRVSLVERGILKDFLGTRWPRKGHERSNGHARGHGGPSWTLGVHPAASTLLVTAGSGASGAGETRTRFLEEIRARELPFGIAVRAHDDDSIGKLGATSADEYASEAMSAHASSELPAPASVWRIFPDGREERLRGVRWGDVGPEALRNILAATPPTEPESIVNVMVTGLDYAQAGPLGGPILPHSIVAPGIVALEEAPLEPIEGPFEKRPLARARRAARR